MHATACIRCIYNKTFSRTPVAVLPLLANEWIIYSAVGWKVAVLALEGIRQVVYSIRPMAAAMTNYIDVLLSCRSSTNTSEEP